MTRGLLFVYAALACFVCALLVALGVDLGGSTWQEWIAGGLVAYLLSAVAG